MLTERIDLLKRCGRFSPAVWRRLLRRDGDVLIVDDRIYVPDGEPVGLKLIPVVADRLTPTINLMVAVGGECWYASTLFTRRPMSAELGRFAWNEDAAAEFESIVAAEMRPDATLGEPDDSQL